MTLSDEGVRLLSRAAILVVVVLVTAFARTLVGRNPKRHFRMAIGTVGGMAAGIAVSGPLSGMLGFDVSSLSAMCGIFAGWAVAYQFVKHIPRDATQPTSP
jgi:hypothetical protein